VVEVLPFHIVVLALVQGITEFLPISSSGHLILTWELLDQAGYQQGPTTGHDRLILDIAVHVGTLFAVLLYVWRDILDMVVDLVRFALGRPAPSAHLAAGIVLGTLPLVAAGWFLQDAVSDELRSLTVIAWTTIGFGVLLYVSDRMGLTVRRLEHMTLPSAFVIGLVQVLAFLPGTSRAGITMTAARFLGFERAAAARFSLLLAIPAILGAGTLAGLDLYRSDNVALGLDALLAAGIAFVSALIAIALMMSWLKRATFTPFVIYRLLLGAALLYIVSP
jgi:undecaprenyl-diphosphatase